MDLKSTPVSSKSHDKIFLEGVETLRIHELLFDCTLKADGQEVSVHKLVLAACSDYFQSMFCGSMKESKQSSVELHGITAATLKALVNFAYTGDLNLSLENVEDIVSSAQYFQMAAAVVLCTNFLQENLTLETVVNIQNLASTYAFDNVQRNAEEFMLKNFENIPEDNLHMLERAKLLDLLDRNSLIIKSEYTLFEKLISCQSVFSEDTLHEALNKVRFPLMTSEELSKVADSDVMSSSRNMYLLEEALLYKKDVIGQPRMQTDRTQVRSNKTFTFLGDDNDFFFHTSIEKPVVFVALCDHHENLQVERVAVVDNFLYVCGNTEFGNGQEQTIFLRYDPRFDVWQNLPRLSLQKHAFPLIPHQGQIYAVGGMERSVECFSISDNKWQIVAPINYFNSGSAGVVCDNRIYISGGGDYLRDDLSDVACYDPASDTWKSRNSMILGRQDHLMATINGKIFVFGGSNIRCSGSVEYLVPEIDQWTLTTSKLTEPVCALFQNCTDVYICRLAKKQPSGAPEDIVFEKYEEQTGQIVNSFQKEIQDISFEYYRYGLSFKCGFLTFP